MTDTTDVMTWEQTFDGLAVALGFSFLGFQAAKYRSWAIAAIAAAASGACMWYRGKGYPLFLAQMGMFSFWFLMRFFWADIKYLGRSYHNWSKAHPAQDAILVALMWAFAIVSIVSNYPVK